MSDQKFAMDYIDVAARIVEFREKYPNGRLRPMDPAHPYRIEEIAGQVHIVVVAAAHRDENDQLPGVGMAYEVFPGRTPYTRGSELQNAETSAWGRAIVAALAADTKRGVASAEEVRNRREEQNNPLPDEKLTVEQVQRQIIVIGRAKGHGKDDIASGFQQRYGHLITEADVDVLLAFRDAYRDNGAAAFTPAKEDESKAGGS